MLKKILVVVFVIGIGAGWLFFRENQVPATPKVESSVAPTNLAPASSTHEAETAHSHEPATKALPTARPESKTVSTRLLPPAERTAAIERSIDDVFGKAIYGLGLTAAETAKVRAFLIEQKEADYTARNVAIETPGASSLEVQAAVRWSREQVADEMRAYFGDEKFGRIKAMQDAATYLGVSKLQYEPELQQAGITALDPSQTLRLGVSMREAYGDPLQQRRLDPSTVSIETGLTTKDVQVLAAASEFLSPPQLTLFQKTLAARNRDFLMHQHK